jgi:polyisoprenoid-binding protein YceI
MQFPEQISLEPSETAAELRTYGFGMIPFDGKFTRFRGCMRYDASTRGIGEVILQISAASLAMSNELVRDFILGPEMMDVARFPELAFRGTGWGKEVVGALSMHGETHRLAMGYTRSAGTVTVTGRLRRKDWGIMGGQMIGGSIIRIRVALPDPFHERPS